MTFSEEVLCNQLPIICANIRKDLLIRSRWAGALKSSSNQPLNAWHLRSFQGWIAPPSTDDQTCFYPLFLLILCKFFRVQKNGQVKCVSEVSKSWVTPQNWSSRKADNRINGRRNGRKPTTFCLSFEEDDRCIFNFLWKKHLQTRKLLSKFEVIVTNR